MAPLWVACRLSLSAVLSLSVLTCFMLCLTQCASSVLIYDRLSLLNLEEISNKLLYQAMSSPHAPPPLLLSIPDCLRRWPCSLPARRRGRRGGLAIKLKRFLRLHREPQLQLGFHAEGLAGKCFIRWRSLEPVHGWIISVFATSVAPLPVIRSPRFLCGGVCTDHLRSLPQANLSMDCLEYTPRLRMALINARSLVGL